MNSITPGAWALFTYTGTAPSPRELHSPPEAISHGRVEFVDGIVGTSGTRPSPNLFIGTLRDSFSRPGVDRFFGVPRQVGVAFVNSKFKSSWELAPDSPGLDGSGTINRDSQILLRQDLQSVRLLVCDWLENIFQERAGSDHGARQLFDGAKAYVAGTDHGNDDAWRANEKDLLAKQSNIMSRKTANYFSYMATLGVRKALEDMDTEADILEAAHKLTLAPDAAEGAKGRFDPAKFNDFTDPLVWSIQGSLSPVWDSAEVNRAANALYTAYRTRSASELLHHTEYPFDPGFAADLAAPTGEAHHLRTAALPSLRPRQLPPILLPKPPAPPEPPAPPPDNKLKP